MRTLTGIILLLASTATQAASCTLAVSPLAFGSYNSVLAVPSDSQANLSVTCQSGLLELVSYSVALSAGNSGNTAARYLLGGGQLSYNLYKDILRTNLWGTGANAYSSSLQILTILTPFTSTLTVYGRIPALQSGAPAGSYSDSIQATLTF